ncbi:MAG: MarR family winged helix-turn-helix transcriptional regulator [Akkermansiaceae bacterium]
MMNGDRNEMMNGEKESELVINLISINSKIQKRVGGSLSAHGIGLSEYLVLNQLILTPSNSMRRGDLAEKIGLSPSGITRLINPMVKIGLVEKEENPRDARVSLVTLSTTGKQVYEDAKVTFAHASSAIFESLETEQLNMVSGLLENIS